MDDGLTLQRCQREESQAARIIRNTTALFSQFVRYVSSFSLLKGFYFAAIRSHRPPPFNTMNFQEIIMYQQRVLPERAWD